MTLLSAPINGYDAGMACESAAREFYGYLGRVQSQPDRIVLRFYPIDASGHIQSNPVFEVQCHEPHFAAAIIENKIDCEFEIALFANRLELLDVLAGTSISLRAANLAVELVALDVEDYNHRLKLRDEQVSALNHALIAVRRQNEKFKSVAQELLRRAEIKAAGSEELRDKQKAAIDALQRLLVEIDTNA